MNKKLLLGALIGAGISMLNKKRRQAPPTETPHIPPPDFSRVPPPTSTRAPQDSGLDNVFGGRAQPGAVPTVGGAAVLMDIARRIFQQMQQRGTTGASAGTPAGTGDLNDILGQIFGRLNGKFGQQGPLGQGTDASAWRKAGQSGMLGFAANDSSPHGQEQAELMLHAMVAAAQADGRIDEQEQRNILGALEGQLDRAELRELQRLLTTPVDIDQVVDRVQDPATAFDVYLVSAMTINEDNPREHAYMDQLAAKLGISEEAAHLIEAQVPHAA
ncbi:DUF533 domain-containing protein [Microbulbifer marinus]|uniref:Uncharacterized protein n=1 Tax=Microbulbifer marinus TaxID=658218 RepID=A0A1H3Z926_9GAMM|nr:DUF533 domain-containing protein [Microbulbifer marinus]SEA20249.1 Protein of unknown function [Microbulbifer marinus]